MTALDPSALDIPLEFYLMGGALLIMAILLVVTLMQQRADVRRRTEIAQPVSVSMDGPGGKNLFETHSYSVDRIIGFVNNNLLSGNAAGMKVLKMQLVQAGFFSAGAVPLFFVSRLAMAAVGLALGYIFIPSLVTVDSLQMHIAYASGGGMLGYLIPTKILSRRIEQRQTESRRGFPDFMDLMVVCAEAGLSMEASVERVARELAQGYPALAENLYMVSLEVRAGKKMVDGMLRLSERLGLEEAQSLATLLQQSAELGSSMSQSLKVYSDDMRNKRMSLAEEKAYALPAKLVVPLTLFVFPVLIVTLLFPAAIRISTAF